MPQFDVHRVASGRSLVIDCQSDLLDHIDTRFVAPLIPLGDALPATRRLNPVFAIDGRDYLMLTQAAAAVPRRDLGPVVASLAERSFEITGAIDVLIGGV